MGFCGAGDLDLLLSNASDSFKSPDRTFSLGEADRDRDRDRFTGDLERRSAVFDLLSGLLDRLSLDLDRLSLDLDLLTSGVLERLSRDLERSSGDRALFSGVGDRLSSLGLDPLDRSADLDRDRDLRADRLGERDRDLERLDCFSSTSRTLLPFSLVSSSSLITLFKSSLHLKSATPSPVLNL